MRQANESVASVAQNPVFTPEDVMGNKDKLAPKVDFNMPVKEEEEVEEVKAKNPLEEIVNTIKPMTAEEEEKRKRGAMSASAIAHLGNMMGALGNVINVNRGAVPQTSPTVKSPDTSSFEEKVRKQREAHADRLYKIDALIRQQDKDEWTRRQAEAELELKKQTAKYNDALNALKIKVEQGKLTAQEYDNEVKRIKAKYEPLIQEATLNKTKAQAWASNASATASLARARSYDANKGKYFAEDKDGNVHYFDEYGEAEEFGLANGTWKYDTYDEVTTEEDVDDNGNKTTTTRTTTKRGKGYPVRAEARTSGSLLPAQTNKNKATLLP
jgi:hypothetical protein